MFGWKKKERGPKGPPAAEAQSHAVRIPTVAFDHTRVTDTVKAALRHNIASIRDIGVDNFDLIYDAALRSISAGRALHILYQALMSIEGMTRHRAEALSLSLNNKATALTQAEKQQRLGIEYAVRLYSNAPCGSAEQNAAHKAANGTPYLVENGLFLNGRWTWSGREDGCKCISKPLIAGIAGYAGGLPKGFTE